MHLAIIGTGNVARRNYIPFLARQEGVTLSYCNRSRDKAEACARGFGGTVAGSIAELLAAGPDAVLLLSSEQARYELARLVGVHPNHLCRLFTRSVGVPPHQYLKRLRLRRAQELLQTTDLGIDAIAEATGFADVHHFTRAFSGHFSTPPAHFRKAALRPG